MSRLGAVDRRRPTPRRLTGPRCDLRMSAGRLEADASLGHKPAAQGSPHCLRGAASRMMHVLECSLTFGIADGEVLSRGDPEK